MLSSGTASPSYASYMTRERYGDQKHRTYPRPPIAPLAGGRVEQDYRSGSSALTARRVFSTLGSVRYIMPLQTHIQRRESIEKKMVLHDSRTEDG
jgi:hypothetical protein